MRDINVCTAILIGGREHEVPSREHLAVAVDENWRIPPRSELELPNLRDVIEHCDITRSGRTERDKHQAAMRHLIPGIVLQCGVREIILPTELTQQRVRIFRVVEQDALPMPFAREIPLPSAREVPLPSVRQARAPLSRPAAGECCHRGLARRLVAVRRRAVLVMAEGERPHPRHSYQTGRVPP